MELHTYCNHFFTLFLAKWKEPGFISLNISIWTHNIWNFQHLIFLHLKFYILNCYILDSLYSKFSYLNFQYLNFSLVMFFYNSSFLSRFLKQAGRPRGSWLHQAPYLVKTYLVLSKSSLSLFKNQFKCPKMF